ncbi:chemotaxis response regulator protein-glutamate methylesterase [Halanaerocella petrolearia]
MGQQIKVLIIDDSSLVRRFLQQTLDREDDLEVVGAAGDPYKAVKKIKELAPDVLTLDIEMPRMSGLEFLQKLMRTYPLPVVMISSLTNQGSKETIKALELGAVDFVAKSDLADKEKKREFQREVINKVKMAAQVTVERNIRRSKSNQQDKLLTVNNSESIKDRIIAIGASTGGVKALKKLLPLFPPDSPPIVIIQHMPQGFTQSFAQTLDHACKLDVKETSIGDQLQIGEALVVPGNFHLTIKKEDRDYYVELNQGPKVNYQRPAIDVTFKSLAQSFKDRTIGILLTGMGQDGAQGLKKIKEVGGYTIAQNKKTATIFGMPKEAIRLGAVTEVASLEGIADKVISKLNDS